MGKKSAHSVTTQSTGRVASLWPDYEEGVAYTGRMIAGMGSPVALVFGSGGTGTEEARAFFQDRLRLYAGWVFVLAFGFYGLTMLTSLAMGLPYLFHPATLWHVAATGIIGSTWLLAKRVSGSAQALLWLDAGALTLTCFCFAMLGAVLALGSTDFIEGPVEALLVGQLACSSTILARTVAVPSTAARTLWLGVIALTPHVVASAYVLSTADNLLVPAALDQLTRTDIAYSNFLNTIAWSGTAVAISAVGSGVIFGLRAEADKVRRLGQYTLEEKIGEGGMGSVYRASHAMLRRPTAIKLLPPEKTGEESIRRFEREVQLTARLSHPSTIAIFDYGRTPDGVFYYAMEYLEGLNLEQLVQVSGPQEPGRVIHILRQVSGALTEAHEVGLIHRDIKPANIILCQRGGLPDVAKVVDFGLVKPVVTTQDEATMMGTSQHLLVGTPMYMAPEAIKGEHYVDGRSDLYALGAVGYFMLTGRPIFNSNNVVEIVAHHLHTIPAPPSQRTGRTIPPDLEAALTRCLAKDPRDRFGTARELTDAMVECAGHTPWSLKHAAELWESFTPTRPSDDRDEPPTVAIDFRDRM